MTEDIQQRVEAALAGPYHRVFVKEDADRGYSAWVIELPGVFGGGETIEEANTTLEEALADWVATVLEDGQDLPPPLGDDAYELIESATQTAAS